MSWYSLLVDVATSHECTKFYLHLCHDDGIIHIVMNALLAQLVEQLTLNQRVEGSSPSRETIVCPGGEIGRRTGLKILR